MTENITDVSPSVKFRNGIPRINMVVTDRPQNPVMNGKNRWKFPSSKDCCVKIGIVSDTDNVGLGEKLRVSYDQQDRIREKTSKTNGLKFLLEVSCITRHGINNEDTILDIPLHLVCLQQPLNSWRFKRLNINNYGFWFRFFGKSCRFHVKICLKMHQGKPGSLSAQDKVINTVELDIINHEIIPINNFTKPIKKLSRKVSLYSEKGYLAIMEELQTLQEKCLWEKCRSVGDKLLCGLDTNKSDYKVCILLEQSKVACQQEKLMEAKSLVKAALEMIPTKSKNKMLLTARAYTYLSLAHQYDMAFGNAEECLRIAKTKLSEFMPCEDTGDFYYHEGKVLLGFVFRLPVSVVHNGLIQEAKEKMEMAISHFRESYNWRVVEIMNKIYSAQMYTAMLLLFANRGDNSALIADQMISSMGEIYDTLSHEAKCKFNLAQALLMEQKGDIKSAVTSAKVALDLSNLSGLYLEKRWIENLLRRLQKSENEEYCTQHNDIVYTCTDITLDSQSVYEADGSEDIELQ